MMNRRRFTAALGVLAAPWVARAQSRPKVLRIGILTAGFATAEMTGPNPSNKSIAAFLAGMREQGYEYGVHYITVPRGGEGRIELYPELAADLAKMPVDVVVAGGPTVPALMQATSSIPVVMIGGAFDPVQEGLARSLGQPGRNVTGLSIQQVDTTAKRLEILKEAVPSATVAALWEPTSRTSWQAAEAAALARGWKIVSLEVRDQVGIARAFSIAVAQRAGALLVIGGGRLFGQRQQVVDLAFMNKLPAMYSLRQFVDQGGLMSYAANLIDGWRRAAVFVDRILKGANPADMPIEQSTKFELVINLRTAKAMGIRIPQSLVVRADELIE